MERLKTAKEIGELLNLNLQRIYDLTRRNLLPHIQISDRQYRYSESAIQKWIDEGGTQKGGEHDDSN